MAPSEIRKRLVCRMHVTLQGWGWSGYYDSVILFIKRRSPAVMRRLILEKEVKMHLRGRDKQ